MRLTTKPGHLAAADRHLADLLGEVGRRLHRLLRGLLALDRPRSGASPTPDRRSGSRRPCRAGCVASPISVIESDEVLDARIAWPGVTASSSAKTACLISIRSGTASTTKSTSPNPSYSVVPVIRPSDLLELGVGLLLGDLLLLDEAAELALRDLAGLLQTLVDELLLDVLEHDGHVGGGEHLGDLAAHRAGADDGGFEHEHAYWGSFVREDECPPRSSAAGYRDRAAAGRAYRNSRRPRARARSGPASRRGGVAHGACRMKSTSVIARSGPACFELKSSSSETSTPSSIGPQSRRSASPQRAGSSTSAVWPVAGDLGR